MQSRFVDALVTALIAGLLAAPLAGARTVDGLNGLTVEWHLTDVAVGATLIFLGRYLIGLVTDGAGKWVAPLAFFAAIATLEIPFPSTFLKSIAVIGGFVIAARAMWSVFGANIVILIPPSGGPGFASRARKLFTSLNAISLVFIALAIIFPFTPLASRYALDVAIMILTYIMLAWGLNVPVGYAGLLDLGYAGFYAIGAYSTALLAHHFAFGFWTALPIAGLLAAVTGFLLGLPVLRLRGDYFAVVTLGFGEIVRLVVTNWTNLTNGPNGISDIPRPTFFGLEFARSAGDGHKTFNNYFGINFEPTQRVIFLYFIILILALLVGWFSARLRKLPIGYAWEAFRENEIATAALGINRWSIKLAAYSMGAAIAGLAGAFFATRQGFISPESFTFTESATMLAIVILGGIGHPLGIALAAIFVIGLPEAFREFEQYRMLAFGAGMVLIMIWRPGGMIGVREPSVMLGEQPDLEAAKKM